MINARYHQFILWRPMLPTKKLHASKMYTEFLFRFIAFAFCVTTTSSNRCPQKCICPAPRSVKCTYKSLTMIPSHISKSVSLLDLSGNTGLKITKASFQTFTMMTYLKLAYCSLNTAFMIPKKVNRIYLQNNNLGFEEFYTIFYGASPFIRLINVSSNKIHITKRHPLINATNLKLQFLYMDRNSMKIVYNETFRGFHHLKILSLNAMGIEKIEKDAFQDLSNLVRLSLMNNKLVSLPRGLFKRSSHLATLILTNNKLQAVPDLSGSPRSMASVDLGYNGIKNISSLSEMGIKTIASLVLWHNDITTLPKHVFQRMSSADINLSFNEIKEIQSYSFTACTQLYELYLDSNKLNFISNNAFRSVQRVEILSLSNNLLTVLPPGLFTNLSMNYVLLYNNNISSITNTWRDVIKPPKLILLFDNPIRTISEHSLDGLGKQTKVLVSCDKLSQISVFQSSQTVLRCSPSQPFHLILPDTGLRYTIQQFGFYCRKLMSGLYTNYNCTTCPLGYYGAPYDGKIDNVCQKCPAGSFYQDKLIQTTCKKCPVGQYVPPKKAPGKGPLDCETCPEGTQTDKLANYRACSCLPGFFRVSRFGPCKKCVVPGITCDKDYQMLQSGFWWSWEYNATCETKYQAFIKNLETFNESYSTNTSSFNCKMPLPHKCPNRIACLGNVHGSCHQNYTGPLCALCAKKYYRHFKTCVQCPRAWIAILEFLAYVFTFALICIVINWADKIMVEIENNKELPVRDMDKFMVKHQNRKQRTVADVILSTLKIILGFYQVLNGTVHSFPHIPWPKSVTKALRIFQYIELRVLRFPSLRCIQPEWDLNATDEFWLSLGITFLTPALIGIYYAIRKAYLNKTVRTQRAYVENIQTCKKQCVRSVILFLFTTFPSTSKRIFQILPIACHKICLTASESCTSYLRADYSIKCLSASFKNCWILYLAYASLFIPFGFVIFLLVSLAYVKHSKQVNRDHKMSDENDQLLTEVIEFDDANMQHPIRATLIENKHETTFQFALKFCYENYQPSCWYWEITEMLRKLLFTSILPLLVPFSNIFLGLSIILSGFFALLHAYKKPIQNYFEHWLQMVSLAVIPANLCIAYILDTIATPHYTIFDEKHEKLGISVILVVLNSSVILIVMMRFFKAQLHKLKQLRRRSCSCRCCVACILPCVEPGI